MALMRAMFRCCQGALVSPYQPSSLMFTSTSAPSCANSPHLVGKDRLIADEDAVAMRRHSRQRKTLRSSPRVNDETLPGELVGKEEQILEGNVLAEGNQVNLVVAAHARAVRAHDQRGVVVRSRLAPA